MPSNLVLITTAYPSSSVTEEVFISPELEALSREFDRVIIAPLFRRGRAQAIERPNVSVDWSIADSASTRCKLLKLPMLASYYVTNNYKKIHESCGGIKQFVTQSFYAMNVEITRRQLKKIITRHNLDVRSTVFYTFWFDYPTISLAELSKEMPIHIVSRAHGYDIYDHLAPNRPQYLRKDALSRIEYLFPASLDGEKYLRNTYPGNDHKIARRILGSVKRRFDCLARCNTPESGCVTFLSVARVSPEKGVLRNLDFVITFSKFHSNLAIKWIHVGDGPEMDTLRNSCEKSTLPQNLTVDLRGAMPNDAVHDIYSSQPIDWVMLFSDYEGGCPIAVSEALSYSVPVIANAVGGVPEIMTPCTGITVSHGTPAEEIAQMVTDAMNNRKGYIQMKSNAAKRWEEQFNARKLRRDFAIELRTLLDRDHE